MIGAIIGDIVGSVYEFNNHRSKNFQFLTSKNFFTDDTVMTVAIAKALMRSRDIDDVADNAIAEMKKLGKKYPDCGYGGRFSLWLRENKPQPYGSFGNGAAMRVSPVGFYAKTLDECKMLSKEVTRVTHNHTEGLKGAECVACCVFLARNGCDKKTLRTFAEEYYRLDFTIDEIRDTYLFNETCQNTVPQALQAFFESENFEDAIRTAISVGGDSDTLAAITGAIAEAFYGVPDEMKEQALGYLDTELKNSVLCFYQEIFRRTSGSGKQKTRYNAIN